MRPPELAVSSAVVALARALRRRDVEVSVDEELALCRALAEVDVRRRTSVYWAARACLLRRRDDAVVFDELFERFWAGVPLVGLTAEPAAEHGEGDPRMAPQQHGGESLPQYRPESRPVSPLDGDPVRPREALELETAPADEPAAGEQRGVLAAYSPVEVLTAQTPLPYDADDLAAVRRLAEELRARLPARRSRRERRSRRRGRLDLRRTLRRSHATDGEALRLVYAAPSLRPRRLLFLCDVSGSMERYSSALLASLGAIVGASRKAEAFVFATRLTRLTTPLAGHDLERALDEARRAVADWSGGTRIGEALRELRVAFGSLGLARGAIVVVVSDGWDRGDPELLASELRLLRLTARRLVWVNPRPAELDGQPLAVGMRAALPYVDDLVAGRDTHAVEALGELVGALGSGRPARSQRPVAATGGLQASSSASVRAT